MTNDVIEGKRVIFRTKCGSVDVAPHLKALEEAGIGENDSDRIRLSIIHFTKFKRLDVPAQKEDCGKSKIKLLAKGAGGKTATVSV